MRAKRKCELCSNVATIYCESDQASLCNECDSKVHGANFLVAKHLRTLLCHFCQSSTLWTGSGPKFGPTVSFCPTCLHSTRNNNINHVICHKGFINMGGDHSHEDGGDEDLDDVVDDEDDDDDDDGDDDGFEEDDSHNDGYEVEDDDDEENQVVPWSYSVSRPR